jgi:hypothetical protein
MVTAHNVERYGDGQGDLIPGLSVARLQVISRTSYRQLFGRGNSRWR